MEYRCQVSRPRSLCSPFKCGKWLRESPLRGVIAALVMGGAFGPVSGAARAETTENDGDAQNRARAVDPEVLRNQPTPMRPLERRKMRLQKKTDWWNHARTVLFTDLELDEEQQQEVDDLIEEQLRARSEFLAGDAKFKTARRHDTREEVDAIREELREVKKRLRDRHELFEDMRALLAEEQRPTFDMNRARLIAEDQDRIDPPEPSEPEGIPVSSRQTPSN